MQNVLGGLAYKVCNSLVDRMATEDSIGTL